MDGLEDRVRSALGAGALAADPSLVDIDAVHAGVRVRQRRRMAAVSVAGVVALVGVVTVTLAQTKPGRTDVLSQPTATPSVTPSGPSDGRLAWLPLPPSSDRSFPTPSAAPKGPECRSSALRVERPNEVVDEVSRHLRYLVSVTNTGSAACTLSGRPNISIAGGPYGPDAVHDSAYFTFDYPQASPATMSPGESAYVQIDGSDLCAGPVVSYRDVELVMSDGRPLATGQSMRSSCGLGVGYWFVNPPDSAREPVHSAAASLIATIDKPLDVQPGRTLDYTVSLHNPSDEAFTIVEPCRDYVQVISDGTRTVRNSHALNCAAWDGVIPGRGSVRFQMKAEIPAGFGSVTSFYWAMGVESIVVVADAMQDVHESKLP